MLALARIALGPVLLLQGRAVRRDTPKLPEAAGPRTGEAGSGTRVLRLLLVGDSAMAGVGARHQGEALAGRLGEAIARRSDAPTVRWNLVARTGVTTAEALQMLDVAWAAQSDELRADIAVVGVGVNDVTGQVSAARWLRDMASLADRLERRHGASRLVFSGLPPMHRFPALPQPLRWYLGECARRHDRALRDWVGRHPGRSYLPLPEMDDPAAMADDGFHPGPAAYRAWGEALARAILRADVPAGER